MDFRFPDEDLALAEIDTELVQPENGLLRNVTGGGEVTECNANPGMQLADAERLGEVVVRAGVESANLVLVLVSRGKDEVRAYYGRMVGHDKAILNKYLTKASIGAPAKFYGDVAIADGSTLDEFYPIARGVFKLDSRWSTTVVKNAGQWKIVSLHLSSNVFNNPLIDELKGDIVKAGVGGLVAGLVLMWLISWALRRRARVTSP